MAVVIAVAVAAFGTAFAINDNPTLHRAARENDAMAWLRTEFRLDDAQFAAIKKLHDEYSVVCAEHCTMITTARERSAPAAELARLEQVCVEAMTNHFRAVAAVMSPGQGERYLATVLPRIPGYQHASSPTVRVHQP